MVQKNEAIGTIELPDIGRTVKITKIKKSGQLVIRIPKKIYESLSISENDSVEFKADENGELVMRLLRKDNKNDQEND